MFAAAARASVSGSLDEVRRSLDDAAEQAPAAVPQLSGVSQLPARYKVRLKPEMQPSLLTA